MIKTVLLLLICYANASAQSKINFNQFYPIDRSHSFIEFSIKYMGYAKMKGRFSDFSGMLYYDEGKPERTSISLGIKTESIDTDSDFRDNDLRSDNWFDAKQFPFITFSSKSIKKTKNGFEVKGDITMKSITKEIILKLEPPSGVLKDVRQDHQVIFVGSAKLNRTDYNVEGKNWSAIKEGITAVGNEVSIDFSILAKQAKIDNYSNRVKNVESAAGKIYKAVKEQGASQGIEVFKTLKESGAADRNSMSTVGYMLTLEGNLKEAILIYEVNHEAYPDSPEACYDLGEALGMSGDLIKSKNLFQEAVKRNPNYFWAIEVLRHF